MTISTFILAIALVESGNDPKAVGKHGELSEYQITRQVWNAYTTAPFTEENLRNQALSRHVALKHADHLLQKAQHTLMWESERAVVIRCAAGWHRGEAYTRRPWRSWREETRDYADRVWNVYQDLQRKHTLPPAR